MDKLWGGRFESEADKAALSFHSSLAFDKRLYQYDIMGSLAHAEMLGKQGIISDKDFKKINDGLKSILADIQSGKLAIAGDFEDIHSFIESTLIARIGEAGKRLHTARSRNDQVCLDMRMYVRDEITHMQVLITKLLKVFLDTAHAHTDTIMPGFTHLQKAQPITLAHHIMAYVSMFCRDLERLEDCYRRTNVMPLGSGALATTSYPIDRNFVAKKLNFDAITTNSLDAVSDRDFCIELVSALSICMMHLSRFCEELIIWSNDSFEYITISDGYATGSSIMPQKKNPDMAELVRGKSGRVFGHVMALLTTMKGLPLAYNKDMQEDKEATFDAIDTTKACLDIFTKMFASITFNKENMRVAAAGGYTNATDAADWLVKKGMPFREAHEVSGKLVLYAIGKKKKLEEITLSELKAISEIFDDSFYAEISIEACVKARSITGGPAKVAVMEAIKNAEQLIKHYTEKRG